MRGQVLEMKPGAVVDAGQLPEALEGLAVAAQALTAAVETMRAAGGRVEPELAMFAERASKAAQAGEIYRAKHFPRATRLRA
jgi:hypothetical protein